MAADSSVQAPRLESRVRSLVYYVSGHGFGHAVRSAEIMRALLRRRPDLTIHVRTSAPTWLFPPAVRHTPVELDVGVIQPDALRVDVERTLARAGQLAENGDAISAAEAEALRQAEAGLVVADIPALAFKAARRAGLPAVAIANFSWDWIYEPYVADRPAYRPLLAWLRDAYALADELLRLPLHGELSAFPVIRDVPLVVPRASAPRAELRARFGFGAAERLVLLSFGGLGIDGLDATALGRWPRYRFLATRKELRGTGNLPPNVQCLAVQQERYADLVAACDAVVSKPGYGIVANCLAGRVPLLYTERDSFREYPVLVDALERHGHAALIPRAELLAGQLGPWLDALLARTPRWTPLRTDGAEVVAERLLAFLT